MCYNCKACLGIHVYTLYFVWSHGPFSIFFLFSFPYFSGFYWWWWGCCYSSVLIHLIHTKWRSHYEWYGCWVNWRNWFLCVKEYTYLHKMCIECTLCYLFCSFCLLQHLLMALNWVNDIYKVSWSHVLVITFASYIIHKN